MLVVAVTGKEVMMNNTLMVMKKVKTEWLKRLKADNQTNSTKLTTAVPMQVKTLTIFFSLNNLDYSVRKRENEKEECKDEDEHMQEEQLSAQVEQSENQFRCTPERTQRKKKSS